MQGGGVEEVDALDGDEEADEELERLWEERQRQRR
jgi:hypothetical protein